MAVRIKIKPIVDLVNQLIRSTYIVSREVDSSITNAKLEAVNKLSLPTSWSIIATMLVLLILPVLPLHLTRAVQAVDSSLPEKLPSSTFCEEVLIRHAGGCAGDPDRLLRRSQYLFRQRQRGVRS